MQVLYIEDCSLDRMAFERVLRTSYLPIQYTCAETLQEGLSRIRAGKFDVIIADLRLPDGSGLDLLSQIGDSDSEIIILTGVSDVSTAVQAMKGGACDYIVKDASREYLTTLPGHLETINKARIDSARERLIGNMCRFSQESFPIGFFVRNFLTGETLFFNSLFASRFGLPPYPEFIRTPSDHTGFWDSFCSEYGIPVDQINHARRDAGEIIRHDLHFPDGGTVPLYSTVIIDNGDSSIRQFLFFFGSQHDIRYEDPQTSGSQDSLSVLAGGIAHEMNNVLTSILCDVSLARELSMYETNLRTSCFDRAEQAIRHGRDIALRLLTYADGGYPLKTSVSLQDLIAEVLPLHHHNKADISLHLPDDLDLLEVDPDLMRTALRAVVMNAVEASADRPVRITAENRKICLEGEDAKPGSYIQINIHDSGPGMDPLIAAKALNPFFTTKEGHLGLGLTSARSIIERHEGTVELIPAEDGTIVRILLPSPTGIPSIISQSGTRHERRGSSGTRILVMDDEPGIREVLQLILGREGFQVDVVNRGEDAISAVTQAYENLNPYQIVILDLIVPGGMGGKEAIEEIKRISPSILAIVSSGYSDDPISSRYQEYGFDASLPKPYHPKDMISLVFSMLDEYYRER